MIVDRLQDLSSILPGPAVTDLGQLGLRRAILECILVLPWFVAHSHYESDMNCMPAGPIANTAWPCCDKPWPSWTQKGNPGVHLSPGMPCWGQPASARGHGGHRWQAAGAQPLVHSCA